MVTQAKPLNTIPADQQQGVITGQLGGAYMGTMGSVGTLMMCIREFGEGWSF